MKKWLLAGIGLAVSLGLAGVALSADAPGTKSISGTLEDGFCYTTMGAHGASHKKCAMGCVKKGIPVALVENGTHKIFIVLPPKNDEPIPDDVISKMEDSVTITGKEYSKGGVNFITAESVK